MTIGMLKTSQGELVMLRPLDISSETEIVMDYQFGRRKQCDDKRHCVCPIRCTILTKGERLSKESAKEVHAI